MCCAVVRRKKRGIKTFLIRALHLRLCMGTLRLKLTIIIKSRTLTHKQYTHTHGPCDWSRAIIMLSARFGNDNNNGVCLSISQDDEYLYLYLPTRNAMQPLQMRRTAQIRAKVIFHTRIIIQPLCYRIIRTLISYYLVPSLLL